MEREKLRFLSLAGKDQPRHASRVTERYKMLDCIWGHPSSRPPGSPKQICLGVYPGCTSASPLKISPTLHLPSPNPARLPGGPEPLDGPVSVSRPEEGSIRSSMRVERQEPGQLTPRGHNAGVEGGMGGARGGDGRIGGEAGFFHGAVCLGPWLFFLFGSQRCDSQRHLCDCTQERLLGQRGSNRRDPHPSASQSPREHAPRASKRPDHP